MVSMYGDIMHTFFLYLSTAKQFTVHPIESTRGRKRERKANEIREFERNIEMNGRKGDIKRPLKYSVIKRLKEEKEYAGKR